MEAAAGAGIVTLARGGGSALRRMAVADPGRVRLASRRLLAVLDDPAPGPGDRVFAVLADAAGVVGPNLRGRDNRPRRSRLDSLRQSAAGAGDDADDEMRMLRDGLKEIAQLSALARTQAARRTGDGTRTIDEQIGMSKNARQLLRFSSRRWSR